VRGEGGRTGACEEDKEGGWKAGRLGGWEAGRTVLVDSVRG